MTVNKVCGCGLKAVILAAQAIQTGDADTIIVAGGLECMSGVPYYLKTARWGIRMDNQQAVDGMVFDGLWDPYADKQAPSEGVSTIRLFVFRLTVSVEARPGLGNSPRCPRPDSYR